MNILLLAYSCEPNKGSEQEVGWKWAKNLAKNNKVFVLTRSDGKDKIEKELENFEFKDNIKFYYLDLSEFAQKIKKKTKLYRQYYFFWQIKAIKYARQICSNDNIDICHHVTFVTYKVFSALAFTEKPFIFGPVAGGERVKLSLYKNAPLKSKIKEIIRDVDICISRLNLLNRYTIKKASKILCTTEQTRNSIPKRYRDKCSIMQAIGVDELENRIDTLGKCDNRFNIIYAGNLIYLKGIYILIDAFEKYLNYDKNAQLTLVGGGSEREKLEKIVMEKSMQKYVKFEGKVDRNKLMNMYLQNDVMLFPSLHDSGGFVVVEALSQGIPVISLKVGGPEVNLKNGGGILIELTSYHEIVESIVDALKSIKCNREEYVNNVINAQNTTLKDLLWENKCRIIDSEYNKAIGLI